MKEPPSRKSRPQVLDLIEATSRVKTSRTIVDLRPHAKRFVFDTEGSRHLGNFIKECPDLLLANRQFALPPFETTYVEVDLDAMIDSIGTRSVAALDDATRDLYLGFLVHKRRVYSVVLGTTGPAIPAVFFYDLDTPSGVGPIFDEPVILNDNDDDYARSALLLGSTANELTDDARREVARSVRINFANEEFKHISRMSRREQINGAAGDIRTLWAALLLLNQKHSGVRLQEVPWQAAIYNGKRRVFSSHSIVHIHLAPKQSMRAMMRPGLHVPHAAHDVRAHFAHYNLRDGCTHDWPLLPEVSDDGVPRWQCQRCGGLRVRKKAYTTGDARVGFTTKDYSISR